MTLHSQFFVLINLRRLIAVAPFEMFFCLNFHGFFTVR